MSALLERPILPSADDAELAKQASRQLSKAKDKALHVQLEGGVKLRLPDAVKDLLYHLLTEMAQGNAVTIFPIHAELTTQEAADYLNVSRPYLVRLLEQGKVAFHMTGTHRRIRFSDLDAFRKRGEEERKRVMAELAEEAQELGMGY